MIFGFTVTCAGSCQSPPSQCVQTFQIERDRMDINVMPGVVNCFSCALDTTGDIAWLVEMDGDLVLAAESPDAVTDGNFLVIAMPDSYVLPGPSGRRNIACASLVNEQTFEARLSLGMYNYYSSYIARQDLFPGSPIF